MRLAIYGELYGAWEQIGVIDTAASSLGEQFSYCSDFAARHPDAALSLSIPASEHSAGVRQTRAYFENLLPEGHALAAVAKKLETKSGSYLKILQSLGSECIGAVLIQNEAAEAQEEDRYRAIPREELAEALRHEGEGVAALQVESKLSLAGAQYKAGFRVSRGEGNVLEYALPYGLAASTHIVKTANRRFEALSENECYCLRLARECGIAVPRTMIDRLCDNQPLFVIERFDRQEGLRQAGVLGNVRVNRIHQEDFCQALGKPVQRKYEKPGQHYVRQMRDLIADHCDEPVADIREFTKMIVFNVLIGNCDAHLKNFSLIHGKGWDECRLAPAYDMASTVVYEGLDRRLAMRMGSCTKIDDVSRDDLLLLSEDLRISKAALVRILDQELEVVSERACKLAKECREEFDSTSSKLDEIAKFALLQANRLRKQ